MSHGRYNRRSIRLRGYDYSRAGTYFVTIITQGRTHLFGKIENGTMYLNGAGEMVQTVWDELRSHYPGVDTDEFVVMPDHIHGIIILVGATPRGCLVDDSGDDSGDGLGDDSGDDLGDDLGDGRPRGGAPTGPLSLSDVVHRFKTMTTTRYVRGVKNHGWRRFDGRLWQRNYWEHIIRNETSLNRIRKYIRNNPSQWNMDK